jgi:hypothetical protein
MSRLTREMFCLMEGRHVHPSTLYPGGVGTVATPQVFTDYLVRLMRYLDFVKKIVPMNDDLFNFFYEALPGYEEVGRWQALQGTAITRGSKIRLRPRPGGDVFDLALAVKIAIVEAIEQDYEDRIYLAVTLEDDPGRDLGIARQPGHLFFFSPKEVEPLMEEGQ